jgi:hypothetical protein
MGRGPHRGRGPALAADPELLRLFVDVLEPWVWSDNGAAFLSDATEKRALLGQSECPSCTETVQAITR